MVDVKGFNGGLNTDSALELLPSGDYTYAMNILNGPESITNLLGNRPAGGFPANTNTGAEWICGAFFDKVRQRIIYFTNHERGFHRIISYSVPSNSNQSGSYLVLFEDLNGVFSYWPNTTFYSPDALIKDIKVIHREYEGDLYYFIDPKKKLLKFNYNTIQLFKANTSICAFGWTSANYDGTQLNDGTPIQEVTNQADWELLTVPAWRYYNDDPTNNATYGKLYNWYAVSHPNFAPIGYRVPNKSDWETLIGCLGGIYDAGGKMKSTSNLWQPPNLEATNESLLNMLPGGAISGIFNQALFMPPLDSGKFGFWWSSTEHTNDVAWFVYLDYTLGGAYTAYATKSHGFSVRLIKQ